MRFIPNKRPIELAHSFHHVRTQLKDAVIEEEDVHQTPIIWHLTLGLSSLCNSEQSISIVYKLLSLGVLSLLWQHEQT